MDFNEQSLQAIERLLAFGRESATIAIQARQPVGFLINGPFCFSKDGLIYLDVCRLQMLGSPGWEVVTESADGSIDLWFEGALKKTVHSVSEALAVIRGES